VQEPLDDNDPVAVHLRRDGSDEPSHGAPACAGVPAQARRVERSAGEVAPERAPERAVRRRVDVVVPAAREHGAGHDGRRAVREHASGSRAADEEAVRGEAVGDEDLRVPAECGELPEDGRLDCGEPRVGCLARQRMPVPAEDEGERQGEQEEED